jgi:diadenosine tetraphosphate (Ap4A) HIT family hydrolase
MADGPEQPCSYCMEIDGGPVPSIRRVLPSRVLFEDDDFLVFPTLGQMTPGYLLIVTRVHAVSMAGLDPAVWPRLYDLIGRVAYVLESEYGLPVLVYEHGDTLSGKKGGACISHAHIHLLPFPSYIPEEIDSHRAPTRRDYLTVAKELWSSGAPYLYTSWPHAAGEGTVYNAMGLKSQFMRREAARVLGKPDEWDWGGYPEIAELKRTFNRLQERLKSF